MTHIHDRLKLAVLNALSWIGTGLSLQHVQAIVAIVGGLASLAVSLTSIWYIRKQARALDRNQPNK